MKTLETDSRYEHLVDLIDKQWAGLRRGVVMAACLIGVVVVIIFLLLKPAGHLESIAAMEQSSARVAKIAEAALDGCFSKLANLDVRQGELCNQAMAIIRENRDMQKAFVEKAKANEQVASPETLSLLQLVGGTAVLAILGYLGLARLQNLDLEMAALRTGVFDQIGTRVAELRTVVRAEVVTAVEDKISAAVKSVDEAVRNAKATVDEGQDTTRKLTEESVKKIEIYTAEVSKLMAENPWLRRNDLHQASLDLHRIDSVDRAQAVAEEFRNKNFNDAAAASLEVIVKQQLEGDNYDFHNAYIEAIRLGNRALALNIARRGLESFPDDYDLQSDKARALFEMGKPLAAKAELDEWRRRSPAQFVRGWRPIVFYSRVVQAIELTPESKAELLEAFSLVLQQSPYEGKAWSAYARFLISTGDAAAAEEVLVSALEKNVYSQELHFVYGGFLLRCGRSEEAVGELEKAVRADYQDQFQPDVPQGALFAMLAQAYEAAGRPAQAKPLYLSLKDSPDHIGSYAAQRLAAIAVNEGEVPPVGLATAGAA